MATQNLYGVPIADPGMVPGSTAFTTAALNASNVGFGSVFMYEGGHGAIVGLIYRCTAILSPPTYRFSLQGVSSRGTPDGTVKGSTTAKADLVPTAVLGQATFDTPYTGSAGDVLSSVCTYQTGTVDASHTASFNYQIVATNSNINSPYSILETAGTWAVGTGIPCLAPVYNDGYVGRRFLPANTLTGLTPTSASNPLYYGSYFVPSINCTLSGALLVARVASGSSFTVSLFEGANTTAVSSATFNPDLLAVSVATSRETFVAMPSYSLTAGTIYRLVFSMTTGTAFTTCVMSSFSSQSALQSMWGPLAGTTGSSGGLVWTDYVSSTDWRAYPIIPCIDTFVSSGGVSASRQLVGMSS